MRSVTVYLLFFFAGMYRKCGKNKKHYERIMENNKAFLKLSFMPLTFIVSAVSFYYTITETNLGKIEYIFMMILQKIGMISSQWKTENIWIYTWLLIKSVFIIIFLIFVVSWPMQLMAYGIIKVIEYIGKYKEPYKRIYTIYRDIIIKILKHVFR